MLTTFKNSILEGSNYAENGQSFISNIHAFDNQRLYKLKKDLSNQLQDNKNFISVSPLLFSKKELFRIKSMRFKRSKPRDIRIELNRCRVKA
jgi:hypothetical protein